MQQITRSIYVVRTGEIVTIEIEATKVGNFATLAIDGKMIDPLPGVSPLTFQFPVTVTPGFDHFGMVTAFISRLPPLMTLFSRFLYPEVLEAAGSPAPILRRLTLGSVAIWSSGMSSLSHTMAQ